MAVMGYTTVRVNIGALIIDGIDEDDIYDDAPVSGKMLLEPMLEANKPVQVSDGGRMKIKAITAFPVDIGLTGEISHRNKDFVTVPAPTSATSNVAQLQWRAKFMDLKYGLTKVEVPPIYFYAEPGASIDLGDHVNIAPNPTAVQLSRGARGFGVVGAVPVVGEPTPAFAIEYETAVGTALSTPIALPEGGGTPSNSTIAGIVSTGPTKTALDNTYAAQPTTAALDLFRATSTAKRNSAPVVVVGAGDSHTAGSGATTAGHRWLNLFAAALQKVYVLDSGATSPPVVGLAAAVATPPSAAGIQVVNAAVAGSTAANYLTDTTGAQVAALNPALIVHAVGSNDYDTGVSIATYTANLLSRIQKIDAAVTKPVVHLLVHTHLRMDPVAAGPTWTQFHDALEAVAKADPARRAFVDVSAAFKSAMAAAGDPLDLIGPDDVHLTDAGHAFFATAVAAACGLPAGSVPAPRTPVWNIFTSDGFAGADGSIVARNTDAAAGGTAKPWEVQTPGTAPYAVAGNVLTRGATAGGQYAGIAVATSDVSLSFKVSAFPVGGPIYLELRRTALAGGDAILLELAAGTGFLGLKKRVGGVVTSLGVTNGYGLNERLEVRAIGSQIEVFRGANQVGNTVYDSSVLSGAHCGVATSGAATSFGLDDLIVKTAF